MKRHHPQLLVGDGGGIRAHSGGTQRVGEHVFGIRGARLGELSLSRAEQLGVGETRRREALTARPVHERGLAVTTVTFHSRLRSIRSV